jgi:photosystem II stability/assembly factor-like uncharacterized protein
MTKLKILTLLFATFFLINCKKDTDTNQISNEWKISKIADSLNMNPRDMFFVNSEIGFVVGCYGKMYKTINSGKSWQELNSGTSYNLYSVYFINADTGFVSGGLSKCQNYNPFIGSLLLKTTNGGETWSLQVFKDYTSIYCLKFFNKNNGLSIIHTQDIPNSRDFFIAKTENGGDSWEFIDLAIKPTYNKFYCIDNVVFIAGENQKIYKSINWGDNWETISTPIPAWNDVRNLYFCNETIGYVDGVTNIFKTIDGGLNWEIVDFPFSSFGVFHFYNENEGLNVEEIFEYDGGDWPTFKGSIIYQTSNEGENWNKSELIDSLYLGITYFPERNLGYGVNHSEFYSIKKK